jgi:hypothetical protein
VTRRSESGEIVVGKRLGILMDEFHPTGGLDVESEAITEQLGASLIDDVTGFGIYSGLTAAATLDPEHQPFLFDHRIDGTPVLPGVMGMELFAEAARLGAPGMNVAAIEDVEFLAPFKFYRDEPRTATVHVTYTVDGDEVVAHCALTGTRILATQSEPQTTTHFTGLVRLAGHTIEHGEMPVPSTGEGVDGEAVYGVYFHGPAYQVIDHAWTEDGRVVSTMSGTLPENHRPIERALVTSPRLAELCFQTAGLWEIGTTGLMGLPTHIDRLELPSEPLDAGSGYRAVAQPEDDGFQIRVVDDDGNVLMVMVGYQTARLPTPAPEDRVEPIRGLFKED